MSHPIAYTTTIRRQRHLEWEDAPTITAGEARACLAAAILDRPGKPCPINKSLTRADSHGILLRALPEDDAKPINPTIALNVLRLVLHRKRL